MTNVVAVEPELKEISAFLSAHGFKVVELSRENPAVDAIVYTGRKLEDIYNSSFGQGIDALEASVGSLAGALVVNAQGKSPQEVLKILTRRSYESIL